MDELEITKEEMRLYQIEIRVYGLCFTTPWFSAIDSKPEEMARNIASSIGGMLV